MAPKCTVHVLEPAVDPQHARRWGARVGQLVDELDDALAHQAPPDLINMSAGCPTRNWTSPRGPSRTGGPTCRRRPRAIRTCVLVAAAGNNSSPWSFWPASFEWAVGVGSLDRDGRVSDFSNWGDSVDVFALGRNVVNAFPNGTYVCHECPDRGDARVFDRLAGAVERDLVLGAARHRADRRGDDRTSRARSARAGP